MARFKIINEIYKAPLCYAIEMNRNEAVKLLLSQPQIDINLSSILSIFLKNSIIF